MSVLAEQKARNDDAAPFPLLGVVGPAHRGAGERGEAATGGVGAWWTAGYAGAGCADRRVGRVAGHVGAGHTLCHGDRPLDRRAGRGAPAPVDHVVRPFPAHLTQAGGPAPRQGPAGLQAQVTHWRETQIRDLLPLCHAILAIDVLNRTDSACWSHSSNVLA
ncbi:MAG: hypothetical protein E6I80_10440 [Chloroflexi bacterium]|nr:MAG: hypothetical protein E6I80_10440 [Chloroflexota bacterium]